MWFNITYFCFRQSRLMAYRQFCLWAHQGERLGKHKRRVLPSCVVGAIRQRFPAEKNDYTGFLEAREVSNALDTDSDWMRLWNLNVALHSVQFNITCISFVKNKMWTWVYCNLLHHFGFCFFSMQSYMIS